MRTEFIVLVLVLCLPVCTAVVEWWNHHVPNTERRTWRAARVIAYQVINEFPEVKSRSIENLHTYTQRYIERRFATENDLETYVLNTGERNCITVVGPTMDPDCDSNYYLQFHFVVLILQDMHKVGTDNNGNLKLKRLLLRAWALHPSLRVDEDFYKDQKVPFIDTEDLPKLAAKLVSLNSEGFDFKSTVSFKDETYTRNEVFNLFRGITNYKFAFFVQNACASKYKEERTSMCNAIDLIKSLKNLGTLFQASSNTARLQEKKNAAGIGVITFLMTDPDTYEEELQTIRGQELGMIKVVRNIVETIWALYQERDHANLDEYIGYLPNVYGFIGCNSQMNGGVYLRYEMRVCILRELLDQYRLYKRYLSRWTSFSRSRIVDKTYNYQELLDAQRQSYQEGLGNIQTFSTVATAREGLMRFKKYYGEISSFNEQLSASTISYINGQIKHFRLKEGALNANISDILLKSMKLTLKMAKEEVAWSTLKLTTTVFEGSNPFKFLFTSGSVSSILEATDAVTTAARNWKKATQLATLLIDVTEKTTTIAQNFKTNQDYIDNVRKLVLGVTRPESKDFQVTKEDYLRLNDRYSPSVELNDITAVSSIWDAIITEGCEIQEDCTSAVCAADFDVTDCVMAHKDIETMTSVREEIYEFQFKLLEELGNLMEFKTSQFASMHLTQTPTQDETETTYSDQVIMIGNSALMTFQMQRRLTLMKQCDLHEWRRAGVLPTACSDFSNGNLIQTIEDAPCRISEDTYSIPIKTSTHKGSDRIDLLALYSGEFTEFQIPSWKWLEDNDWITPEFSDQEAWYMQGFKIFLPTANGGTRRLTAISDAFTDNRLRPQGPVFIISPLRKYYYEYRDKNTCDSGGFNNPYNSIISGTRKICPISQESPETPDVKHWSSIFSRWRIRVVGYTDQDQMPTDLPSNFKLRAKIKICKKTKDEMNNKKGKKKKKHSKSAKESKKKGAKGKSS